MHVLDSRPLALPTEGFRSVGVWDPHLVRTDDGWLVGYVSATKYFTFHPALAAGPSLDALTLRAVATDHRQTEGTTIARLDGQWRVLASDKRRRSYPVMDLDLRDVGTLDAAYPDQHPVAHARCPRRTEPVDRVQRRGVRRPAGRVRQPRRGGDPASRPARAPLEPIQRNCADLALFHA